MWGMTNGPSDFSHDANEWRGEFDADTLLSQTGYLCALDLFRDLSRKEVEEIDRGMTVVQLCPKGRVFYTPGETGERLFIIKRGAAHIYRLSPQGRKLVIAQVPPKTFFGEMSCVGQGMRGSFAEAAEDSLICAMTRADVEQLLWWKPQVTARLIQAISRRVIAAERLLAELTCKQFIPRLAALLLREAEGDAVNGLSPQALAERLGVCRETVTSGLHELKTAGLIELGRKQITILDRRRLQRAATDV
jgi:CRP/FNR family cyclic AMP-dependent transcriptional regulator